MPGIQLARLRSPRFDTHQALVAIEDVNHIQDMPNQHDMTPEHKVTIRLAPRIHPRLSCLNLAENSARLNPRVGRCSQSPNKPRWRIKWGEAPSEAVADDVELRQLLRSEQGR